MTVDTKKAVVTSKSTPSLFLLAVLCSGVNTCLVGELAVVASFTSNVLSNVIYHAEKEGQVNSPHLVLFFEGVGVGFMQPSGVENYRPVAPIRDIDMLRFVGVQPIHSVALKPLIIPLGKIRPENFLDRGGSVVDDESS